MDLFEILKIATITGKIKWTATGSVIETISVGERRGYESFFNGFHFEIIVKEQPKELFECGWAIGFKVKKDEKELTLTTNPRIISGEKDSKVNVGCYIVQKEIANKDVFTSLSQELTKILY